jgi:glycosyltransferase involved in cell wall biosynthesis
MYPLVNTASIIVLALNEEASIGTLFVALEAQDYPLENIELILVDSGSSDNTKALMQDFAERRADWFLAVKVLDNPKRVQPAGWNVGITNSTGDAIFMLAAHAFILPNFVSQRMAGLNQGEYIYGGPWIATLQRSTRWREVLLAAEQSIFGSGGSVARRATGPSYVSALAHAGYRREVFEAVGLYDERLVRTEDNELSYRVRAAGFRFCSNPEVTSYHFVRDSFKAMMRQKYSNGFWVGKTLLSVPACINKALLVPAIFVVALIVGLVIGLTYFWLPLLCLAIAYGVVCVAASVLAGIRMHRKTPKALALPFILLGTHLCYGIGTLVGLASEIINPLTRLSRGAWTSSNVWGVGGGPEDAEREAADGADSVESETTGGPTAR